MYNLGGIKEIIPDNLQVEDFQKQEGGEKYPIEKKVKSITNFYLLTRICRIKLPKYMEKRKENKKGQLREM